MLSTIKVKPFKHCLLFK